MCRDFRLLSDSGTYDRRDGVSDEENHVEMLQAMVSKCLDGGGFVGASYHLLTTAILSLSR